MSPGRTERGELATWPGVRRAGPRQGQSPALTPGQRRRRRRLDRFKPGLGDVAMVLAFTGLRWEEAVAVPIGNVISTVSP